MLFKYINYCFIVVRRGRLLALYNLSHKNDKHLGVDFAYAKVAANSRTLFETYGIPASLKLRGTEMLSQEQQLFSYYGPVNKHCSTKS